MKNNLPAFALAVLLAPAGLLAQLQQDSKQPVPLADQQLLIGPVAGLTTVWHPAPPSTAIPLGSTVQFKMRLVVPDTAVIWTGAREIFNDGEWSVAECHLENTGSHFVSAETEYLDGYRTIPSNSMLDVVNIRAEEIALSSIRADVEPVAIDEENVNASTYGYFAGESIASLKKLSGHPGYPHGNNSAEFYRTSIGRTITFSVDVEPEGFAPLIEWQSPGNRYYLGESVEVSYNTIGEHEISAGIEEPRSAIVETYEVAITSHISNQDILLEGEWNSFTARTDPSGFEHDIVWLASTKYGTSAPIMGRGPEFKVKFDDTWGDLNGSPFQWLGVKADNAVFNQDQKMCVTPLETTPLEGDLLLRVLASELTGNYEISLAKEGYSFDFSSAIEQTYIFHESNDVPDEARHAVVPVVDANNHLTGFFVHSSTTGVEGADFVRFFTPDIDPEQRTVRTYVNPDLCEWVDVRVADDNSVMVDVVDKCSNSREIGGYGQCLGLNVSLVVAGAEGLGLGTACRALCATCAIPPHLQCVGCGVCALGYIGCATAIWWGCL